MRTTLLRAWKIALVLALPAATSAADMPSAAATGELLFTPAACGAAPFADVLAGDPYCGWILRVITDGIAGPCTAGRYCPHAPVTRAQAAQLVERAIRGTQDWEPGTGALVRTIIVTPIPGDEMASGQRLLDALAGISGSSASNPYLVWIEGGDYDLGSSQLAPPAGVSLTAPALGATTIETARNGTGFKTNGGTWSRLILRNNGPSSTTVGVDATNASLKDVIAYANGGAATAIRTNGSMERTHGVASGNATVIAIDTTGSGGEMVDCTGFASGGAASYGLRVGSANLRVVGGSFEAGSGDLVNYAIYVSGATAGAAPLELRGLTARATGDSVTTPDVVGLKVEDGDVVVDHSRIEANNSNDNEYALDCRGTADSRIEVHHSRLIGPSAAVEADDADCVVRIGHSQLKGGAVVEGAGDVACVAAWGDSFSTPDINACF